MVINFEVSESVFYLFWFPDLFLHTFFCLFDGCSLFSLFSVISSDKISLLFCMFFMWFMFLICFEIVFMAVVLWVHFTLWNNFVYFCCPPFIFVCLFDYYCSFFFIRKTYHGCSNHSNLEMEAEYDENLVILEFKYLQNKKW